MHGVIIVAVRIDGNDRDRTDTATTTWNDAERIAVHRDLSPSERLKLTIEASRAALRFAHGRRVDEY
jgi:hypothetical protein